MEQIQNTYRREYVRIQIILKMYNLLPLLLKTIKSSRIHFSHIISRVQLYRRKFLWNFKIFAILFQFVLDFILEHLKILHSREIFIISFVDFYNLLSGFSNRYSPKTVVLLCVRSSAMTASYNIRFVIGRNTWNS